MKEKPKEEPKEFRNGTDKPSERTLDAIQWKYLRKKKPCD
jgi:hypothetical protein